MTHLKNYMASAIVAVFSLISVHSLAQPAVKLASASGHPGDDVELAVQAQGFGQITAAQLNIDLPQTLTYVENSAALSQEVASASHQLQVTQTGNQLKIYVYSLQLDVMKNYQGKLLTFRLHVGNEPGTYQLTPSAVLSNSNGGNVSATVTSGQVTVLAPSIQLSAEEIDFGSKPIRSTYSETVTLSNTGNEPLTVTAAQCSSDRFSVTGLPCTIQPDGQQTLTVSYAPLKAGVEDATIMVISNAANGTQTIHVKAEPYSVNELRVKCSTEATNNQFRVSVEMENMDPIVAVQCAFDLPDALVYVDGSAQLNANRTNGHQLSASIVNGKLKVYIHSASNMAIPANSGELFSFCIAPDGASGDYQLSPSDVILSNAAGENMLSGTTEGTIHLSAPKLEAETEVDFGNLPWAAEISHPYQLRNVGERPLTISRIVMENPALTVSATLPLTIEAGATKNIQIVYHPKEEGAFEGVMQLYSNDPDQQMVVVNIQGSTYYPNQLSLSGNEQQDGQYALTINLQNSLPIVALQADIHWIPGMTTKVSDISLSDRAGNHQMALNRISDDTYRLFIYSTTNQQIATGQGALLTLIYNKVNSGINYQGTTITVDNVILSTLEGENQSSASVATMAVNKKGDVNGDGLITVADVTAVVDVLLERQMPNISVSNADINGDGEVTIVDVVEAIHLVLTIGD